MPQLSIPAQVEPFLDKDTETYSYVVYDEPGGHAAIIDAVLDFNPSAGRTSTAGAQRLVDFVHEQRLTVDWVLEAHAHADHLSAAPFIHEQLGGKLASGEKVREVQQLFWDVFNLEEEFLLDGCQFDHLFSEGETFRVGKLEGRVIYTPGHTLADMSWMIGGSLFVGDTLFMPDVGTFRCDFPGGDAATLYRSIQKLLILPGETPMYMCRDYPPDERGHQCLTTVAEQKSTTSMCAMASAQKPLHGQRDTTLEKPRLILPSIQVNILAGHLPTAEANGITYLKIPINYL